MLGLLFFSCQRDIKWPDLPQGTNETPVNDALRITGGITGIVVDENNRPVSGASVSSGTNTTTTDRYGAFRFRNISLSKANGSVKVEKNGYFTGYRSFIAVEGRINNVRIKLLPKTSAGSFNAVAGGTLSLPSGARLLMPADAVADAAGTAYTGQVNVAMTWIDPSSADLPYTLMGDLRGITTGGAERGLSTFGMIGVEMTGATGQPLQIAAGKKAELTFPIPASLQAAAPDTIDLWHFDEVTARWKQEGRAVKTSGNLYLAQVSHFSFWNCDAPFPLVDLCMSLKDNHGTPLINAQVRIKRILNNTYGYGRTDSLGNLCGKVPKDENLELQVLDLCHNPVFTQAIGPFSSSSTLPPVTVTIPAQNSLVISGTITNCASANVTSGAAAVYLEGGQFYVVPVSNGAFSLQIMRCGNDPVNFTVLGFDYSTLQQSAPFTGSGNTGTVSTGTLNACGTSAVQFIELLIDGTPYSIMAPPDAMYYSDSLNTGTYTNRTWVNGFRQNSGAGNYIQFNFLNNQAANPALPLEHVAFGMAPGVTATQNFAGSASVNVTAFGATSGTYVEGNFSVQMNIGGTPKNVLCNFRVRRN